MWNATKATTVSAKVKIDGDVMQGLLVGETGYCF
jgi:hypothetical protein